MLQDKGESLKIKLKSVTKLKLSKIKAEHALRNTERVLSEELREINAETQLLSLQLEDLKQEISKLKCQLSMIGIFEVSESCKTNIHISNLTHHKNGFEQLFHKENEEMEYHKTEMKKQELEKEKIQNQKKKAEEEKNQLQLKEASTIEEECNAIEQECVVLKKRNKAIMLKLRRKLIESEDMRRELSKNTEFTLSKE